MRKYKRVENNEENNIFEKETIIMKLNKHLQTVFALTLLLAIVFIFFGRIIFGEVLIQSDIIQYRGMSAEITAVKESTGKFIHWTNSMFGGMPTYFMNDGIYMQNNIAHFVNHTIRTILPNAAGIFFIALFCGFIFARSLTINRWLSIMAAVGFAASSFVIISLVAGHNSKINAYAWAPLILAGIIYCFRNRPWLGLFALAFGLAAQLAANHLQITFYTFLVALCLFVSEILFSLREKKNITKPVLLAVIGVILALGVNYNQLVTSYTHSKTTIRGGNSALESTSTTTSKGLNYDYATQWSYEPLETFTLAIPNFMGGATKEYLGERSHWANEQQLPKYIREEPPTYWGKMPFTSGPVYIGAAFIALFFMAMFTLPNRHKWWAFAASLLLISLSWGKYSFIYNLFFSAFPLFNKFRTPMMALLLLGTTIPFIGTLALQQLNNSATKLRKIYIGFGIAAGLVILFGFLFATMYNYTGAVDEQLKAAGYTKKLLIGLQQDRAMLLREDALRSLFIIGAIATLVILYVKGRLKETMYLSAVIALGCLELTLVSQRYINAENFESKEAHAARFTPNAVDQAIYNDKSHYRVFNVMSENPFAEATTSLHHFSIGGYHAAKLQSTQDVIDRYLANKNIAILNALNTKYFIGVDEQGNLGYQQNGQALGNAWFVNNVEVVNNDTESLEKIGQVDLAKTAILSENELQRATLLNKYDANAGQIKLTEYQPEYLSYTAKVEGDQAQFAVFSEVYYKQKDGDGWLAFIDGKEVPLLKTNFFLRGIQIPVGEHKVEMRYSHAAFSKRGWASKLFSALLLLSGILFLKEEWIDQRKLRNA